MTLTGAVSALQAEMRRVGITTLTVVAIPAPMLEDGEHPGLRLKRWREARGWTQAQLGEALGYTVKTPSNRPTAKVCDMIAQVETLRCGISKNRRAKVEELTGIPAGDWLLASYGKRHHKNPTIKEEKNEQMAQTTEPT